MLIDMTVSWRANELGIRLSLILCLLTFGVLTGTSLGQVAEDSSAKRQSTDADKGDEGQK